MIRIAIDGACRNNGKPSCIAAGGVFVLEDDGIFVTAHTLSTFERPSTSQRGELLALRLALEEILRQGEDAQIITDSEYIFNTMTKEWYNGWESRGWLTAIGDPVKNTDLWKDIVGLIRKCHMQNIDAIFYHIKGHCISLGKVTTQRILGSDDTGWALYEATDQKLEETFVDILPKIEAAQELSVKNNGFRLDYNALKTFIAMNTVADAVATKVVEAVSTLMD